MQAQPLQPGQLVVELGAGPGIAVGGIDRGHPHHALLAGDHRFQIAGMVVGTIAAGQARRDVLHRTLGQDGDAVIAFLSVYGAIIAQRLERLARESLIHRLDFLQAQHIGLGLLQPGQRRLQPRLDRIDVPGGDFHGCVLHEVRRCCRSSRAPAGQDLCQCRSLGDALAVIDAGQDLQCGVGPRRRQRLGIGDATPAHRYRPAGSARGFSASPPSPRDPASNSERHVGLHAKAGTAPSGAAADWRSAGPQPDRRSRRRRPACIGRGRLRSQLFVQQHRQRCVPATPTGTRPQMSGLSCAAMMRHQRRLRCGPISQTQCAPSPALQFRRPGFHVIGIGLEAQIALRASWRRRFRPRRACRSAGW